MNRAKVQMLLGVCWLVLALSFLISDDVGVAIASIVLGVAFLVVGFRQLTKERNG